LFFVRRIVYRSVVQGRISGLMVKSATETTPATQRRSRPIVLYLVVLALVAFVPVMAFSAVLLQRNNEAQQEIVQTLVLATTEAIGQAVDQQTEGMITTLKGFSSAPMSTAADLDELHTRGAYALAGTGNYLVLLDAAGQQLLNTRFPIGTPLGRTTSGADAIARALDSSQIVISNVAYGNLAKTWIVPIYMPLTLPNGDRDVLVMTQDANNLGSALLRRRMPDGWRVALVDTANKVVAASPDAGVVQGSSFFIPRTPQTEGRRRWEKVEVDGHQFVTISSTSNDTGWRVVAWAPDAIVERPLSNSLLLLIGGGLVIVAAASVATFLLSREITRSVRGLARDARRLGAGEPVPPRVYPISEIVEVAAAISSAAQQRQAAETEVRFLMRELAHRSKNQMTVIAAMAKQTARTAESVPDFVASFEKRIFGLARSTDLLLANGVAGVDLTALLTSQIEPFCPLDGARVTLSGPPVRLNTQSAQILGMAAHELATNAAKYGAFAGDEGRLQIDWSVSGDTLSITWREHVKVLAPRPDRRGFGTTVLESMVGSSLGAEVRRTMHADGIEWDFAIPMQGLDPDRGPLAAEKEAEESAA
jgi:two-component sensor histidine kinase